MDIMRALTLICPLLLIAHSVLDAQATPVAARDDALGFSAGYSWASPQQWGLIQNRHVTMIGLRLETQVARSELLSLVHSFEVPVAMVARKSDRVTQVCWPRDPSICMADTSSTNAIGIGVLPAGLNLYIGVPGERRLFVNAGAGISVFSGNMPTVNARQFNFLVEAGIGGELPAPGRRRFTFGYKYVHFSNADTAPSNPGLDANILYVGLQYRASRN